MTWHGLTTSTYVLKKAAPGEVNHLQELCFCKIQQFPVVLSSTMRKKMNVTGVLQQRNVTYILSFRANFVLFFSENCHRVVVKVFKVVVVQ